MKKTRPARKPRLAGVPDWQVERWLADLADGCLAPDQQREFHKFALHKLLGKPGVPAHWREGHRRRFQAPIFEQWIQNEIARLKKKGPPPPGGYRTAALEICAERWRWTSGAALEQWLRRNLAGKPSDTDPPRSV